MDEEEPKSPDPVTPSKFVSETPILRTPQGGVLYNPFQKDYVSRLGAPTLTPGLFATPKKQSDDNTVLPSGSIFSPEIQGDHFPTEIDENPIYQVQLQQRLDAAVDETAQKKIAEYFKTTIVAPSPGLQGREGRPELRKSSTWKHDLRSAFEPRRPTLLKSSQVIDAQTQTSLSIVPQTDFEELLKKLEQFEEIRQKFGDDFLTKMGINFGQAEGEQQGPPYERYPNAACSYCHRRSRSFYGSASVSGEFSRDETIKNVENSSCDTVDAQSNVSSFQDEFALPFSFMTESVCSPKRRAGSSDSRTNLTSCFNDIALDSRTPIARQTDRFGLGGGRTSFEAERGSFNSFNLDEESGTPFGEVVSFDDEESTRDVPIKENLLNRKRLMESPNLSPIFSRRRKVNPDDDAENMEITGTRLFKNTDSDRSWMNE